jgi:hypothetical protein
MRNAPVPKGMVTAFLLGIVVKKECIVNAFNILSTPIRRARGVLPLVENAFFIKKKQKKREKRLPFPFFHFLVKST